MSPFFKLSYDHLRACSNCGRGTFLKTSRIDLYCKSCWENIFSKASASYADDYPFKVCSLFVWTHFTPQIGNLIYSLKQGGLPSAFARLAEQFAFSRCSQNLSVFTNTTVVVPAGRTKEDHAYCWGKALSRQMGYEFDDPFEFATGEGTEVGSLRREVDPSNQEQKRLHKTARFERQFKLKSDPCDYPGPIVFVDDLITTGATAVAAYKALNLPKDFEVWTIARRPKLASQLGI